MEVAWHELSLLLHECKTEGAHLHIRLETRHPTDKEENSSHHLNAERASGADDGASDRLQRKMFQVLVRGLYSCDFVYVFQADGASNLMTGLSCTLLYTSCFLEEVCSGGRLCGESKRAVGLDSDDSWDRDTRLDVCCSCIEFFAEVHRFDTASSECRADGRRRRCLACLDQNPLSIYALESMQMARV